MAHDGSVEYYFNTATRMVEKGKQSSWEHLLGPYASAEEAEAALDNADARTKAWEEQDDEWRG